MAAADTAAARLPFSKMHGAGNDFVVLDLRRDGPAARRMRDDAMTLCRALADRRAGAGCDQVLTILPPRDAGALASYGIHNADGSLARQCGNGARCVAAWLVRDGSAPEGDFALDSPGRRHAVRRRRDGDFEIAMGRADFAPASLPMAGVDTERDTYALTLDARADGARVRFGAVSLGNPHAVIEVDAVSSAPVADLGPALQRHAAFPESVNVGFAEVRARDVIALRVYERGVGETLACGSGACAAVAVLARQGRVDGDVAVQLPGGTLRIHYDSADGSVRMSGPATFVYEGLWLT